MKKYVVFMLLLLSTCTMFAGSLIKGKIIDADTKAPIQYVDVALFKLGSKSLTSGVATDSLGVFTFPCRGWKIHAAHHVHRIYHRQ